jgi:hypothetical protein
MALIGKTFSIKLAIRDSDFLLTWFQNFSSGFFGLFGFLGLSIVFSFRVSISKDKSG